jgi:hypothetical protein
MEENCEPESIEDVLDCVEEAAEGEKRVSVADIVDQIGDGAFPPLIMVPALIMISPASAVFGVSSFCGLLIVLIAIQMVVGRHKLWLPRFLLEREISKTRLDKAVSFLSKPARLVDGLTGKRLAFLVSPPLERFWAAVCVCLAIVTPIFELVPMSATIIASAVMLFCLAMLAKDGILALMGLAVVALAAWLGWSVAT